jgi:hypothetical protein
MKHVLQLTLILFFFSGASVFAQSVEQVVNTPYEVIISPNPAEDLITIKIQEGHHKISEIRIYDLIGKEVFIINLGGSGTYHVDLSTLRPGVYFCSIMSEKGVVETRKLIRSNH